MPTAARGTAALRRRQAEVEAARGECEEEEVEQRKSGGAKTRRRENDESKDGVAETRRTEEIDVKRRRGRR